MRLGATIVEFLGTFFLVLTIGLSGRAPSAEITAPIAIASVLIAFIYAGSDSSGAHYNPAVTLSVWLRGGWSGRMVVPYIAAQVAGALLAAWFTFALGGVQGTLEPMPPREGFIAEFVFTFALCFVILSVSRPGVVNPNQLGGVAIGLVVLGGIVCVGRISGGVFNPAVAVSRLVMGTASASDVAVYVPAQCAAGIVAALLSRRGVGHGISNRHGVLHAVPQQFGE